MHLATPPDHPARLSRLAVLALLAAASPLRAEEPAGTSRHHWGVSPQSEARLERAQGHPADVVFTNRLTWGHPADLWFELNLDGLTVDVLVRTGDGGAPDLLVVQPPPGFAAYPPSLRVDDDGEGRIEIYPVGWS